MIREFLTRGDSLVWPVIGMLIFIVIFIGVLAYVFLGLRDRKKIDDVSSLPLADDEGDIKDEEREPTNE